MAARPAPLPGPIPPPHPDRDGTAGLFDDPAAIDDLTEDDVLSWENAGVGTLADFIKAGNAGIAFHHGPARELAPVADEPWAQGEASRLERLWVVVGGYISDQNIPNSFTAAVLLECPEFEKVACWSLEKLSINGKIVLDRKRI